MRTILVLIIAIGAFALPDSVKLDLLKTKLVEQVKAEDHSGTLETIKELRSMNRELPVSLYYYEGKAYGGAKDFWNALKALETYLDKAGKKENTINKLFSYI